MEARGGWREAVGKEETGDQARRAISSADSSFNLLYHPREMAATTDPGPSAISTSETRPREIVVLVGVGHVFRSSKIHILLCADCTHSGATCSGKTTLAKQLRKVLPNSTIIHQDVRVFPLPDLNH